MDIIKGSLLFDAFPMFYVLYIVPLIFVNIYVNKHIFIVIVIVILFHEKHSQILQICHGLDVLKMV